MKNIEELLLKKKKELEEKVAELDLRISKKTDPLSTNEEEQISQIGEDEVIEKLSDTFKKELLRIANAFQRLNDGEYGFCAECEVKIPEKRLLARPYTTHCVDCKEDLERN